jgi:hypothetical protein
LKEAFGKRLVGDGGALLARRGGEETLCDEAAEQGQEGEDGGHEQGKQGASDALAREGAVAAKIYIVASEHGQQAQDAKTDGTRDGESKAQFALSVFRKMHFILL